MLFILSFMWLEKKSLNLSKRRTFGGLQQQSVIKATEKFIFSSSWTSHSLDYRSSFLFVLLTEKGPPSPPPSLLLNFPFLTLPFCFTCQRWPKSSLFSSCSWKNEKQHWCCHSLSHLLPFSLSLSFSNGGNAGSTVSWQRNINKNHIELHHERMSEINSNLLFMLFMWKWFLFSTHSGVRKEGKVLIVVTYHSPPNPTLKHGNGE